MPDLWDSNPHNDSHMTVAERPDLDNGNNDHTKEVMLKDHRGHLRPPAYVLIALVTALAAILVLFVGVLFAPD